MSALEPATVADQLAMCVGLPAHPRAVCPSRTLALLATLDHDDVLACWRAAQSPGLKDAIGRELSRRHAPGAQGLLLSGATAVEVVCSNCEHLEDDHDDVFGACPDW